MRIDLESPVHCSDAAFGELSDVVLDPGTRRLTHLVVQPDGRHDQARLVRAEGARLRDGTDGIVLPRTVAEINQLETIQRSAYLGLGESPVEDSASDVGIQEMTMLPGAGALGPDALGAGMGPATFDEHVAVSYDRVPKGDVELRRTSAVTSSDGHHVGHLVGVVVDDQEQITAVICSHGHLWGKRQVEVPSRAVDRFENDEVLLALPHDAIGDLKAL